MRHSVAGLKSVPSCSHAISLQSFSPGRREMILLSTLSDFLYQKTAFLGERQHAEEEAALDRLAASRKT